MHVNRLPALANNPNLSHLIRDVIDVVASASLRLHNVLIHCEARAHSCGNPLTPERHPTTWMGAIRSIYIHSICMHTTPSAYARNRPETRIYTISHQIFKRIPPAHEISELTHTPTIQGCAVGYVIIELFLLAENDLNYSINECVFIKYGYLCVEFVY